MSDENDQDKSEAKGRAIMEARQKFIQMRAAVFDANAILDRIENARRQTSSTDDELRAIVNVTRERVAWLIDGLDKLENQLGELTA